MSLLPILGRGARSICICRTAGSVVAEVLHFVQNDRLVRDDKFVLVIAGEDMGGGYGCDGWGFDGGGG